MHGSSFLSKVHPMDVEVSAETFQGATRQWPGVWRQLPLLSPWSIGPVRGTKAPRQEVPRLHLNSLGLCSTDSQMGKRDAYQSHQQPLPSKVHMYPLISWWWKATTAKCLSLDYKRVSWPGFEPTPWCLSRQKLSSIRYSTTQPWPTTKLQDKSDTWVFYCHPQKTNSFQNDIMNISF